MSFKNQYLSVSRLKKFEQCPKAFEFHYVKGLRSTETTVALAFGTLLHEVLEHLFRWVIEEEYMGELPEELAVTLYRTAWNRSGLTGVEIYQEGLDLIRKYVRRHKPVNHFDILGVEVPFALQLEEFRVEGRIDRIDRIDDTSIEVIDFKSNRMLFTRDEVDMDLQMSVYALAVKQLFPWAKSLRFTFDMLRHDTRLTTYRTEDQLSAAKDYVVALGRQSEAGKYPAKLNGNCGYCDHRSKCAEYQSAVSTKVEMFATGDDLEKIAELRERVALVAKLAYAKQRDLDAIIKSHLERAGELTLAGTTFRLTPTESYEYPVERTLDKLVQLTGKPRQELMQSVVTISSKRLDQELSVLPAPKRHLAEAELEAIATRVPGTPRINASKKARKELAK